MSNQIRWGTLVCVFQRNGPGDQLKRTIDLFSCPGIIYLVDPDRSQLKTDYDRIRELDAEGAVFELDQLVAS